MGYYLYDTTQTNTNADSEMIQIILRRFNTIFMQQEVVGWGEMHLPATGSYTLFKLPIIYTSPENPDTVAVVIRSSLSGFCDSTTTGDCLYLSVNQLTAVVPSSELIIWGIFTADGRQVLSGSSVRSIISTDIGF